MDILSLHDEDGIKALLRITFNYFIERSIDNVSCWMQDNCLYANLMKEYGLSRQEMPGFYPYWGVGRGLLLGRCNSEEYRVLSQLVSNCEGRLRCFLSCRAADIAQS